ncbi:MAG: thioredoxin domain-containing protein [Terriglobia bacterium]
MRTRTITVLLVAGILTAALWLGAARAAPQTRTDLSEQQRVEVRMRVGTYLRYLFAWGKDVEVTVGRLRESAIPGLFSVLVEARTQEGGVEQVVLVSADGRYLIRGEFLDTTQDPFAEARERIITAGQPRLGPADALVTIVEYGDFQCPTCRAAYPVLEEILASHDNVRLIFKDFPLTQKHDWAMAAAIAAQCAYRQSNERFWQLHDYFFENQDQINHDNLDAHLDALATHLGMDTEQFRTCRQTEATRSLVEQSIQEARQLQVRNTPTLFLNGRRLVGAPPKEVLERLIAYELSFRQQGSPPPNP